MQLDQITLLKEKINKVVLLTRSLKEENESLKVQLAQARGRLEELQAHQLDSVETARDKQKALSLAMGLLDSMLVEEGQEACLENEQEKALKYLVGEDQ